MQWIWHPEIVDLSKEKEQLNEPGKLDKPHGKRVMKSDQGYKRNANIIELATSFEEARDNYGILFVNNPKVSYWKSFFLIFTMEF